MSISVHKLLFVILIVFSPIIASTEENKQVLKFGHAYGENSAVIFKKYAPLIHLLSKELDRDISFVLTNTYEEMQKGYLNDEIDMGIINAYSFIKIMETPHLVPIAARVKENNKNYKSLFIVRNESEINSVPDLKGKSFAFGDPYSTSSFLVPMHHLAGSGIDPGTYFSQTLIIPKQDSIIYSVLNRTVDCGAVASFIFNEQKKELKNKFRIIFKSRPFPLGPFVVNTEIGSEIIEKTRDFLLNLDRSEEGRFALSQADLDPFAEVKKSDYCWLKKIAETGYSLETEKE